ncbi:hypothetical protein ACSQ67_014372 [Phaseolus vulgaris]
MIVRLGVIVAASIAALTVKQLKVNNSRSEHGEATFRKRQDEGTEQEQVTYSTDDGLTAKVRQEEEQKEVMLINSVINRTDDFEDDIPPELESLLSGEIDFPALAERTDEEKKDKVYETNMDNNASELERLRNLVKELEEREVKLEGELLEYYGLKEQEADFVELQRQLKNKTVETDMLKMAINSLQEERKKLQEELTHGASAKRELEAARSKIKELRRQIQLEANQAKTQLLLLKQKVSSLVIKEEEAVKTDAEIGKKLKALNHLEVEVVELKRENKELQHEKRELTVKLNAAEYRITELCNENEMVSKEKEVSNLRHANEDLLKQVEGLQINRFSEVEELVYLRWVNACLRYELKNYQAPPGKLSARDLNISLSPKSQEKAKQLMLEYAGSEHGQGDTDLDSYFSHTSSPGSEDFDNASSIDSFMSKHSSVSKKTSLIQKLKKWGKSKDDSSALSSPARYLSGSSPSRMNMSNRPRDSQESLRQRNAGDSVAITTFGQNDQEVSNSPEILALPSIRRVSSCESLNSVASSFQLMSKTVAGHLDGKYPAYKDRHKLALEREKQIKEKAEKARGQKFGDNSNLNMSKAERERTISLPSKLTQFKEKAYVSGSSNDHPDNAKKNVNSQTISKMNLVNVEKRAPRVPQPPPKPSYCAPACTHSNPSNAVSRPPSVPPPPPPPPPPARPGGPLPTPLGSLSGGSLASDKVHRFPELVEFYQTLMKQEEKNETSSLFSSTTYASDARSNMIGEIENRSSFLLAVKADVETQGDFVLSLATEVRAASFYNIEDLVAFVNWLDEELSFLVDERAVLKHFDWPEGKTDVLREAAFEYLDLMKLENQVSTFTDDPKHPCEAALQKMYSLLEKVEQSIYALLRTRDMAISRYKEFEIPVTWLLDTGVMGKIKLSSVQLANKYMKRVASELDILSGPDKEPNREFLILQGVRFAFRVHQFAGGFDRESMKAFEELRSRIHAPAGEDSSNQKHR